MQPRPENTLLTVEDPEEFRCPVCNPTGWNRTGYVRPMVSEIDTPTMWGTPCGNCLQGWFQITEMTLEEFKKLSMDIARGKV